MRRASMAARLHFRRIMRCLAGRRPLARLVGRRLGAVAVGLAGLLGVGTASAPAAPIAVRYVEGVTHGFLVLRAASGEVLAEGDLLQTARPEGVDSRLLLRFRDGSLYDETAVFTQLKVFTLQSYRLIQRGPTFPEEMDVTLTRERGAYQVRSRKPGAEGLTVSGEVELPPDTYNGMMTTLLKNLGKGAVEAVHVLVFTPKPLLVQLELAPVGEDPIVIAGERRLQATHYVMTPKLGVVRGAAAKLLGKTPPPYHCWVVTTGAPAFVAIDAPLYTGGPIWRVETVSPRGPARPAAAR
jgi:hypothetical protein